MVCVLGCATGVVSSPEQSADEGSSADADADASASTCDDIDTLSVCHACSGASCQTNGCYNGYLCDTETAHCKAPGSCP